MLAVADERRFGPAARRLHMGREPLVRAIGAIEAQRGTELFDRGGRELVPTDEARALAEEARSVLAGLDMPVHDADRAAHPGRALRVGAMPVLGVESVRLFLSALHDRIPGLATQVSHALTVDQRRRLLARELDIGIMLYPVREPGLDGEPLFAGDAMAAYLPVRHPLAAKRVVRPGDVRDEDLVMFPHASNPPLYDWWLAAAEASGYRFRSVREAGGSDPQDLVTAVTSGLGLVLSSSGFVGTPGVGRLVTARALEPPLATPEIAVVWVADPVGQMRTTVTAVRDVARELRRDSAGRSFLGEPGEPQLTAREVEVLQLAAHGLSARRIAQRLTVSPGTVRSHFENLYPKLGAADKAGAVAEGLRRGLIE